MVSVIERTPDTTEAMNTAKLGVQPDLDLFWLYARAATTHDQEGLKDLSFSDCEPIRRRVAGNPATPADVLEWLAIDWHPPVRAAVAENPMASEELLMKLAADDDKEVRLSLAKELFARTSSNRRLLDVLAQDSDAEVREVAKKALEPSTSSLNTTVLTHPTAYCGSMRA